MPRTDPITLKIIAGALDTIAKEMGEVTYRMAYSNITRECEDIGTGLFSAGGEEFCESHHSPMHVGSIPFYIRGFMRKLHGQIEEGDVILHNHPYFGATHIFDICVAAPIFHQGELVGFAANCCHWLDIGGAYPGLNADILDIWAEGKILDSLRLFKGGELDTELLDFIMENVRTPVMNRGDLEAQIASCRLGVEKFKGLVGKYGLPTIRDAIGELIDYSERRLRHEIEKIPDGVYHSEGWLDDDGKNRGKPVKVSVTVEVKGSDLTVDLTGSNAEVETACNVPFEGSTKVAIYYAVRTLLLDEAVIEEYVPQNEGIFRPVKIVCPPGTIFNPRFPRATAVRLCPVQRLVDCFIQALAPVIPDRAGASNSAHVHAVTFSSVLPDGSYRIYIETYGGSYGGRPGKDGLDACACLCENTKNNPIEQMEWHYPLRCNWYELRADPPAAGKWRGGIGITREIEVLAPTILSSEGDRHYEAPRGALGGKDGLTASITLNPGTDEAKSLPGRISAFRLKPGDIIRINIPNAGALGDAYQRDPKLILADVLDALLTPEMARSEYGVVIDLASLTIDERATAELRAQKGKSQ